MRKFYVWSGDLKVIVLANDSIEAALRAVRLWKDSQCLGLNMCINERGHSHHYGDVVYPTLQVLHMAGIKFKVEDPPRG